MLLTKLSETGASKPPALGKHERVSARIPKAQEASDSGVGKTPEPTANPRSSHRTDKSRLAGDTPAIFSPWQVLGSVHHRKEIPGSSRHGSVRGGQVPSQTESGGGASFWVPCLLYQAQPLRFTQE